MDTFIEVEEGGGPGFYSFYPTIPILCPKNFPVECKLTVEIHEPPQNGAACAKDGKRLKQVAVPSTKVPTECGVGIEEQPNPTENTIIQLPIYAATENIMDDTVLVKLLITTATSHPFHPIWANYKFPTAQVRKTPSDNTCTCPNQPSYNIIKSQIDNRNEF